jgi:hemerythrin
MPFMEWTQELETGIKEIDSQHRQFVNLINELDDAIQTSNADGIKHVIEGVLNYTITHFEFEEELMQKAGFSSLKSHQQSHEFFMRKVAVLRGKFNAGENVSLLLLSMLKGWLVNHIKGEDRDYIDSVKKITGEI